MNSKKLLFIGPEFFSYEKIISNEIQNLGYDVTYFSDRPKLGTLGKSILRIKPSLLKNKIKNYWKQILENVKKEKYEYVFVIFGQSFTAEMFKELRSLLPDSKFIYYLWDSVENFPNCKETAEIFDITYSFDPKDCEKYGFQFLPLFFIKENHNNYISRKYDYSLIATIKKGKYDLVKTIENSLSKKFTKSYSYYFLQSKKVFLYYKLFTKEIKGAKKEEFSYERMDYQNYLNILSNSRIVVDVPMSKQNGLTMRTFEALASGCKLITTNIDIKNYPFYDENLIYVFKNNEIDFSNNFFTNTDLKISKDFLEKYSIQSWLKTMLD